MSRKTFLALLALLLSGCRTLQTLETKVTLDIGINDTMKDRITISIGGKY